MTEPQLPDEPAMPASVVPGPPSVSPLSSAEKFKTCTACGKTKPLDGEFWYRDKYQPDGFHNECKLCRINRQLANRKDIDDKFIAEMTRIQSAGVDALAGYQGKRISGEDIPRQEEVFEEIMHIIGGSSGLAMHAYADYLASTPGSKQRFAFLAMVLNLQNRVQESGAAEKKLDGMDYETLVAMLGKIVSGMRAKAEVLPALEGPVDEDDEASET